MNYIVDMIGIFPLTAEVGSILQSRGQGGSNVPVSVRHSWLAHAYCSPDFSCTDYIHVAVGSVCNLLRWCSLHPTPPSSLLRSYIPTLSVRLDWEIDRGWYLVNMTPSSLEIRVGLRVHCKAGYLIEWYCLEDQNLHSLNFSHPGQIESTVLHGRTPLPSWERVAWQHYYPCIDCRKTL